MLLLDTCIVIDYLRNKPLVVNFIETKGKNSFILPTPVIIELYKGVRDNKEFRTLQKEIQHFSTSDIDTNVSQIANKLAEKYALSHQMGLGYFDCSYGFGLSTRTPHLQSERFQIYTKHSGFK